MKDEDNHTGLPHKTPADRFGIVWPLTMNAWSFKEGHFAEPRLRRHLVRIYRRAGISGSEFSNQGLVFQIGIEPSRIDIADVARLESLAKK